MVPHTLGEITFVATDAFLDGIGKARLVFFEIEGGTTAPEQFAKALDEAPPDLFSPPGRGVIISGRGPVWGYAMMIHKGHPTPWLAVNDPRLGAVVVQTHKKGLLMGQIIGLEKMAIFESAKSSRNFLER